jgi:hypothetical protein
MDKFLVVVCVGTGFICLILFIYTIYKSTQKESPKNKQFKGVYTTRFQQEQEERELDAVHRKSQEEMDRDFYEEAEGLKSSRKFKGNDELPF